MREGLSELPRQMSAWGARLRSALVATMACSAAFLSGKVLTFSDAKRPAQEAELSRIAASERTVAGDGR